MRRTRFQNPVSLATWNMTITLYLIEKKPTMATQKTNPLQPGWRVVYYEPHLGLLDGIVQATEPSQSGWSVHLDNGKTIPSSHIKSVTAFKNGMWAGSWLVRFHGLDGQRGEAAENKGKNLSGAEPPQETPSTARGPPEALDGICRYKTEKISDHKLTNMKQKRLQTIS